MNIGVTGTQTGITEMQEEILRQELKYLMGQNDELVLHHGDCIGADYKADLIASLLGIKRVAYPGHDPRTQSKQSKKRAFCEAETIRLSEPYLIRNKKIVKSVDLLIALPKGAEEVRSGTWSTVRYAQRKKVPVRVIWPSGSISIK